MLDRQISKKTALIILSLTIVLATTTGFVVREIYSHNNYDLNSRLEEKLPKILKTLSEEPSNAKARAELGLIYVQREDWEKALKNLLMAEKQMSKEPELIYEIGRAYGNLGNFEDAEAYFLKTVSLKPNHDLALYALGQLRENKGDHKKALAYYMKAQEVKQEPEYFERIGKLYESLGQEDKAKLYLGKVDMNESRDNN